LPNISAALNNQSCCLTELGRWEEALALIEEAVTIRRQLAEAFPRAFLPDLASSLANLANTLSSLNRPAEASVIHEEAEAARGAWARLAAEPVNGEARLS
jgi:tetratricopeptide (TPR) repeat protein